MACSKCSRQTKDFFSSVPDIVIDKIYEYLPTITAAETSVLSKQWRRNWLSLKSLIFDVDFWSDLNVVYRSFDWQKFSNIVSSILFHHNGPIHDFHLYIPEYVGDDCTNHNQWLSFLSKKKVRKIVIISCSRRNVGSYIFCCSDLVYLELEYLNLNTPPTDFSGFRYLKNLVLIYIDFAQKDTFCKLIANCSMLSSLTLENWHGMDDIVIDVLSLKTLIIWGEFVSLAFKNIGRLNSIAVSLDGKWEEIVDVSIIDTVNVLAKSHQLQSIEFGGHMCKVFAANGVIGSLTVTFGHLNNLRLDDLDISHSHIFLYVLAMIKCCPNITKLGISLVQVSSPIISTEEHNLNYTHKLDHLLEVTIKNIKGSTPELKLIEYLLAISTVLKKLSFRSAFQDDTSELKLSRMLMGLPRASPKARLVCLACKPPLL